MRLFIIFFRTYPLQSVITLVALIFAGIVEGFGLSALVPLLTIVIAGKEYGTGSSRDWAAKGSRLLGIKAVIAESFERIHRSNLVGMGVIPFEFTGGETRKSLGLKGDETVAIPRPGQ